MFDDHVDFKDYYGQNEQLDAKVKLACFVSDVASGVIDIWILLSEHIIGGIEKTASIVSDVVYHLTGSFYAFVTEIRDHAGKVKITSLWVFLILLRPCERSIGGVISQFYTNRLKRLTRPLFNICSNKILEIGSHILKY